ncbi:MULTISPECIES: GNAT family N-acetyltransferase [unclassified Actinomyces]|uniref:GNAT family N-acetyltransferase n=1 Tax=unclassified Actinomyces TaxID=2609248 RepID=UPI002017B1FB|nr:MULTISPECIES: GNAT family N-acetyltransferase [unclassified Actinomyces]MCL3776577.1 GNAT family N-acetyltransferase [Actinomyces sp. AC-20-1]MCL3788863.1 GNAT family N-acetyltransferase [Actinomyces sp. 187325]MCL3791031.1 GNAT family N-acetyltransferase [Actinomyces sp. 186855]MCL3793443.1 GNAT family N-acetyltransferase [Actinomyces sp. 217892]
MTYRPLRDTDLEAVSHLAQEAFGLRRYASSPTVQAAVRRIYVLHCLTSSTFAEVAEVDGEVVGVVMARAAGQRKLPGQGLYRVRTALLMTKALAVGATRGDTGALKEIQIFEGSYEQLRRRASAAGARLDHELTLFIVSGCCRGQGVGSRLYADALTYLRHSGAKSFHLYTDTGCSYEFYERRGLERVASDTITLRLEDALEDVDTFLYTGRP